MKFILEFDCDNAAFDNGNLYDEAARILRAAANDLVDNAVRRSIVRDINGNIVGSFVLANRRRSAIRES